MTVDEFGFLEPDPNSEGSSFSFAEAIRDSYARVSEHCVDPKRHEIWDRLDVLYQGAIEALPPDERRLVDAYEELVAAFLAVEADDHRSLLASLDDVQSV